MNLTDERRLWLAGRCPCCGADGFDNWPGGEPLVIAEGVRLCAWCVHRGHHRGDVAPALLAAIAGRPA